MPLAPFLIPAAMLASAWYVGRRDYTSPFSKQGPVYAPGYGATGYPKMMGPGNVPLSRAEMAQGYGATPITREEMASYGALSGDDREWLTGEFNRLKPRPGPVNPNFPGYGGNDPRDTGARMRRSAQRAGVQVQAPRGPMFQSQAPRRQAPPVVQAEDLDLEFDEDLDFDAGDDIELFSSKVEAF